MCQKTKVRGPNSLPFFINKALLVHRHVHLFTMNAFILQRQSRLVVTETV